MAITLKDIAEAVDMSIAAVSLVLGNKPNRISKEKQALIRKTAAEMNYVFDMPSKVQGSDIKRIGTLFPDCRNLHYASMLSAIESIASTREYKLINCFSNDTVGGDIEGLNTLINLNPDAIVFCPAVSADNSSMIRYMDVLSSFRKPVIFAERYYEFATNYSAIAINRRKGVYLVLRYLIDLGHQKIAVLASRTDLIRQWIEDILPAFGAQTALSIRYFDGDDTPLSGYDAGEAIAGSDVTAVFCLDDTMALGLYKKFHEMKVSIPDDISVIGTNDIYYSRCLEVPLTSLSIPGDRYGYLIAERLFAEIEDPKLQKSITLLDPVLRTRSSSSAPHT